MSLLRSAQLCGDGGVTHQPTPAAGLQWCPCSEVERLQQICDLADHPTAAC
jgi:hypothetical protein